MSGLTKAFDNTIDKGRLFFQYLTLAKYNNVSTEDMSMSIIRGKDDSQIIRSGTLWEKTKQGWLRKKWKLRHFVLSRFCLLTYNKETDFMNGLDPKLKIDLHLIRHISNPLAKRHKYLTIHLEDGTKMDLKATKYDANEWARKLEEAVVAGRTRKQIHNEVHSAMFKRHVESNIQEKLLRNDKSTVKDRQSFLPKKTYLRKIDSLATSDINQEHRNSTIELTGFKSNFTLRAHSTMSLCNPDSRSVPGYPPPNLPRLTRDDMARITNHATESRQLYNHNTTQRAKQQTKQPRGHQESKSPLVEPHHPQHTAQSNTSTNGHNINNITTGALLRHNIRHSVSQEEIHLIGSKLSVERSSGRSSKSEPPGWPLYKHRLLSDSSITKSDLLSNRLRDSSKQANTSEAPKPMIPRPMLSVTMSPTLHRVSSVTSLNTGLRKKRRAPKPPSMQKRQAPAPPKLLTPQAPASVIAPTVTNLDLFIEKQRKERQKQILEEENNAQSWKRRPLKPLKPIKDNMYHSLKNKTQTPKAIILGSRCSSFRHDDENNVRNSTNRQGSRYKNYDNVKMLESGQSRAFSAYRPLERPKTFMIESDSSGDDETEDDESTSRSMPDLVANLPKGHWKPTATTIIETGL
ncbi:unnamed protein product [Owenia fusiformis]|uniref:PH domain-containing protein n=1 Tax=Owenia fusiformis TaxID=6347 RepID=A0A8S4NQ34_OWEFU|nr:unnamed protein product [Owenia fusiformis]